MKAVVCHNYGPPDVVKLEDIEKPTAADEKKLQDRGQACDFAILNQESTALTKTVGVSETYGHVGREFKLRPFSAGSILTLRNRIEPLASTTSVQRTRRKIQSTKLTPSITAPG